MQFEMLKVREIQTVLRFHAKERTFRTENRSSHILGIHLQGNALHRFSGRNLILAENTLFFFNQREDYEVVIRSFGEAFSVHFTTYDPIETPSFCFQIPNNTAFVQLMNRLQTASENPAEPFLTAARFYDVCAYFQAQRKKLYLSGGSRIEEARAYLDLHFREKDCLQKAAELCGVSRRRFCDLFSAVCRTTPNRWVMLRKVAYAKSLLQIDGLSIGDIAERSGFCDVYYFSKAFRRDTGLSPTRYREALHGKNNR